MKMNVAQLCLLRSLKKTGCSIELVDILLRRCGASREDWQGLLDWGLVEEQEGRFVLTKDGRKEYTRQKRGRYF